MGIIKNIVLKENNINMKLDALKKLKILLLAGGENKNKFTSEEIKFLQSSFKSSVTLYRGISILINRITDISKEKIKTLKIGDKIPIELLKLYNEYSSYTKKKSLAKRYSEGQFEFIFELTDYNKENILCDTEYLEKIIKNDIDIKNQTIFEREDFDYMKTDKEVIILENTLGNNLPTLIYKKFNTPIY